MPELNLENYSDLIIGLLTLLVGLSIRDWATSFVKGARFRFDPSFAEGDKVILDDQQAMIIKIGLNTTVLVFMEMTAIHGVLYQTNVLLC